MKRLKCTAILAMVAASTGLPATAHADQADDAFSAWNAAFLVTSNGQTYYSTTVVSAGTERSGTWVGALDIAVAEDVYQRTHSAQSRQLVSDLVTTFIAKEGTDWKGDTWDDDIAWMVIAVLRGYQITGNEQFLTVATNAWNMAYDRGWDTTYGGGGVWEDMGHVTPWNQPSKCNLSNNPLIKMGLVLYQMTGDSTYLDKCKGMYAWIRKNLFDATTGLVNECLAFKTVADTTGFVQTSDNAYNSGSFLEAADDLYRITGDPSYYDDAVLAITHRLAKEPILHDGGQGERQWGYRFVKGLSEFATYNNQWSKYQTWLENNANAAWAQRDALNITWNDWTKPTPLPGANGVTHDNDVVPLCTSSAAAIWQVLQPSTVPAFSGDYELQNVASSLSLSVSGAASGSAVMQTAFNGDSASLWTFVPSAGGYYEIQNVSSGLLLDVAADSYKLGANIVQAAAEPHAQGNDQWLPVANADGTYSFYSLSSVLALDNPASSMAAGTQLDQWAGNGTTAQSFKLISHDAPSVGVGGSGGAGASAGATGSGGEAGNALAGSSSSGAGATAAGIAGASGNTSGGNTSSANSGGSSAASATDATNGCSCRAAGSASSSRVPGEIGLLALASVVAARRRRKRDH
jgi:MYXO-CTERM domain-containing protein